MLHAQIFKHKRPIRPRNSVEFEKSSRGGTNIRLCSAGMFSLKRIVIQQIPKAIKIIRVRESEAVLCRKASAIFFMYTPYQLYETFHLEHVS